MPNTQMISDFTIYVCSRNTIAIWAIEHLLISCPANRRFATWLPKQLLNVPQGTHILLVDVCSVSEWPEAVRKWTDAGHRTILMASQSWNSGGAELRALHLGVRGIVPVAGNFMQTLSEAIDFVAKGQLFASPEALGEFYHGCLRPRSAAHALSFREEQVMDLLVKEFSNRRIGLVLGISERTAKFHVCNLLHKLQARSRKELADRYAKTTDVAELSKVS